ncbi:hypothetical protein GKQ38_05060 [Candidatus Nanohaloarchaea archaeon]|nr:hypothetical protein GKQ38_05060 [Candidatus Nanohaloarchaea archaeon]
MSWIKNKILCLIAYALPTPVDFDWFGVLGINRLPVIGKLPVRKIDFGALSWPKRIFAGILLLVPYIDLELFTLLGLDHKLGLYSQGTSTSASNTNSMNRTPRGGQQPSQGGHSLKGIFIVLMFVLLIGGVFTTGYGSLASNTIGNQVIGLDLQDEFLAVEQAVQQAQCFGNAACMRKWRFNNTRRPESNTVGQEYKLDIEGFSVNGGNPVDVGGRAPGYIFPVTFSVTNPRYGLKGITARDAQYRVVVQKASGFAGLEGAKNLCSTGWKPLNGQYASSYGGKTGTIYPGGFATPLGTLGDLNLSACGLMQPALGMNRHVELQVRYNYSSKAQVSVEAMALNNMDGGFEYKPSRTADTPVKTRINVQSPITYATQGPTPRPNVFLVKVGFQTAQNNIRYKVHPDELVIHDSSATVDVNNAPQRFQDMLGTANCRGLTKVGTDTYKLSEQQRDFIRGKWYKSSGTPPTMAICAMILEEPSSISPSGETLRMSIDANYTVQLHESVTNFRALNGRCGANEQKNCPFLVPENKIGEYQGVEQEHLISKCDSDLRVDASDGCDVRKGGEPVGESWRTVNIWNNGSVDAEIEEGETAYTWNYIKDKFRSSFIDLSDFQGDKALLPEVPGVRIGLESEYRDTAIGLSGSELRSLQEVKEEDFQSAVLVKVDNFGKDIEVRSVSPILCKQGFGLDYSANMKDFTKYWVQDNSDVENLLLFKGKAYDDCSRGQGWVQDALDYVTGGQSPKEAFKEALNNCRNRNGRLIGVIVVDQGRFECYDG